MDTHITLNRKSNEWQTKSIELNLSFIPKLVIISVDIQPDVGRHYSMPSIHSGINNSQSSAVDCSGFNCYIYDFNKDRVGISYNNPYTSEIIQIIAIE